METDPKYMIRCIELARLGAGDTAPNPMVGCVIVHDNRIIGEGYHRQYGGPHAEVHAINAVKNQELLQTSTLYVSLEPCAHHGLTPPCSDLIIRKGIPRVVVGTVDPFSEVSGKGIQKLRDSGTEVIVGLQEEECRILNRRFFTFHEKHRPYVILKWARTIDGYIDISRNGSEIRQPTWITGDLSLRVVHKFRSEEGAILVGTNTALLDDPSLTVRHWSGNQPLRVVTDRNLRIPEGSKLLDNSAKTLIINGVKNSKSQNTEFLKIDFTGRIIEQILKALYERHILSVIVEGGRQLLQDFIDQGLWDEAHVFTGNTLFGSGIQAPTLQKIPVFRENLGTDMLHVYFNHS